MRFNNKEVYEQSQEGEIVFVVKNDFPNIFASKRLNDPFYVDVAEHDERLRFKWASENRFEDQMKNNQERFKDPKNLLMNLMEM